MRWVAKIGQNPRLRPSVARLITASVLSASPSPSPGRTGASRRARRSTGARGPSAVRSSPREQRARTPPLTGFISLMSMTADIPSPSAGARAGRRRRTSVGISPPGPDEDQVELLAERDELALAVEHEEWVVRPICSNSLRRSHDLPPPLLAVTRRRVVTRRFTSSCTFPASDLPTLIKLMPLPFLPVSVDRSVPRTAPPPAPTPGSRRRPRARPRRRRTPAASRTGAA
jgi:hypothetical protein